MPNLLWLEQEVNKQARSLAILGYGLLYEAQNDEVVLKGVQISESLYLHSEKEIMVTIKRLVSRVDWLELNETLVEVQKSNPLLKITVLLEKGVQFDILQSDTLIYADEVKLPVWIVDAQDKGVFINSEQLELKKSFLNLVNSKTVICNNLIVSDKAQYEELSKVNNFFGVHLHRASQREGLVEVKGKPDRYEVYGMAVGQMIAHYGIAQLREGNSDAKLVDYYVGVGNNIEEKVEVDWNSERTFEVGLSKMYAKCYTNVMSLVGVLSEAYQRSGDKSVAKWKLTKYITEQTWMKLLQDVHAAKKSVGALKSAENVRSTIQELETHLSWMDKVADTDINKLKGCREFILDYTVDYNYPRVNKMGIEWYFNPPIIENGEMEISDGNYEVSRRINDLWGFLQCHSDIASKAYNPLKELDIYREYPEHLHLAVYNNSSSEVEYVSRQDVLRILKNSCDGDSKVNSIIEKYEEILTKYAQSDVPKGVLVPLSLVHTLFENIISGLGAWNSITLNLQLREKDKFTTESVDLLLGYLEAQTDFFGTLLQIHEKLEKGAKEQDGTLECLVQEKRREDLWSYLLWVLMFDFGKKISIASGLSQKRAEIGSTPEEEKSFIEVVNNNWKNSGALKEVLICSATYTNELNYHKGDEESRAAEEYIDTVNDLLGKYADNVVEVYYSMFIVRRSIRDMTEQLEALVALKQFGEAQRHYNGKQLGIDSAEQSIQLLEKEVQTLCSKIEVKRTQDKVVIKAPNMVKWAKRVVQEMYDYGIILHMTDKALEHEFIEVLEF